MQPSSTTRKETKSAAIVREYLLNNPEIMREVLQELEKKEAAEDGARLKVALKDNADAIFRTSSDLVAGNPKGQVTLVEFFDYNCGYCKRAFPDVMKMVDEDKDLKLVMKEFPILGPGSLIAAKAALASRKQDKYWEFHLAMLGHEGSLDANTVMEIAKSVGLDVERLKADMEAEEIGNILEANMSLAQKLGIQGTPAFIIDETFIPGAIGYEALVASVRQVRDKAVASFAEPQRIFRAHCRPPITEPVRPESAANRGAWMKPVFVLNGPNLNMLGLREPETYGRETLADIRTPLRCGWCKAWRPHRVSANEHRGRAGRLDSGGANGGKRVVLNAAAYTHTSVAIHDAIKACGLPVVEVHLSNVYKREPFRHKSFVSGVADGVICGFGGHGYELALDALVRLITPASKS